MRTRATGLLVFMALVFVVLLAAGSDRGWLGYARALVEASLVGGLADWFAVTALFRHPLGLPIPHTAVIQARKDQFGQTLGSFVQENFLNPDVITERIRGTAIVTRGAAWLSEPGHAAQIAEHLANAAVGVADALRDDDMRRLLEREISRAVDALPVATIAGRALRRMTAHGRHHELLDAMLRGFEQFLSEHRDTLHARFAAESPWWLPDAVDDRIFDRIFDGIRRMLTDATTDDAHELRAELDRLLEQVADGLEHSPDVAARAEALKHEVLGQPELRAWSSTLWREAKATLRAQADDPRSELRTRLAAAVTALGERLGRDPTLAAKLEKFLESAARYLAEHFHAELAELVSGTIARWDAEETSRKLELLLGRDLQFIRINGTVVGGLAGLAIYTIGQVVG